MQHSIDTDTPLMVTFWIENDAHDKDFNAGAWHGATHVLPVYGLYKLEGGAVIPGMLHTGGGESPSHYQGPLYEQKNVDLMNIYMRQVQSLLKATQAKNITLITLT